MLVSIGLDLFRTALASLTAAKLRRRHRSRSVSIRLLVET
jgi:hypothetical protein